MNTVNHEEIETFGKLSNQWWDSHGPMAPLHQMNPLRIHYIRHYIQPIKNTSLKALDIGCGGGILCEPLARLGFDTTGLDASDCLINVAKHHAKAFGFPIEYIHSSIEAYAENASHHKKFDLVSAMEILEHVDHPALFIQKALMLVKPGGYFIVSTLNRTLRSYMESIVGAEYILGLLPVGTHQWDKFLKPSEIAVMVEENHAQVMDIQGLTYSVLKKEWSFCDHVDTNYLMCIKVE
jgi:2-polyprenyl-6-hydroxyphenyl methylase/3-demethylubiquinone-9 3-methyltransferase